MISSSSLAAATCNLVSYNCCSRSILCSINSALSGSISKDLWSKCNSRSTLLMDSTKCLEKRNCVYQFVISFDSIGPNWRRKISCSVVVHCVFCTWNMQILKLSLLKCDLLNSSKSYIYFFSYSQGTGAKSCQSQIMWVKVGQIDEYWNTDFQLYQQLHWRLDLINRMCSIMNHIHDTINVLEGTSSCWPAQWVQSSFVGSQHSL